jgi:hypothetical protein
MGIRICRVFIDLYLCRLILAWAPFGKLFFADAPPQKFLNSRLADGKVAGVTDLIFLPPSNWHKLESRLLFKVIQQEIDVECDRIAKTKVSVVFEVFELEEV